MLFNLLLSLSDAFILQMIARRKNFKVFAALVVSYGFVATVAGAFLAVNRFDFIREAACGIFLHLPIVLFGAAMIWRKERIKMAAGLASVAVIIAAIGGYAFWVEPFWLQITHYEIASPKIKRPLRIAVLADIQTDRWTDYEERVFRETLAQKPDIILLAGDYVQAPSEYRDSLIQTINLFLRQINFSAPQGVFAVQGNIDGDDWPNLFARLDVTVAKYHQNCELDDLSITCLNLEESFSAVVVKNPYSEKFHIVLGHVPNFALGKIDADLLVAGHTHGGQVQIPFFGPLCTMAGIPRSWAAGMTDLPGGGKLLVSRGVGMERGDAPRLRFFCRPELAVIDLVPAK
jgi:predicted MPP superfamily phosphohydrolase